MESGDGSGEILDIILLRNQEGLGFNIRGGIDMPHIEQDTGIFVTKIREVGAAALDGRLAEGDKILELNGRSLLEVTHQTAVNLFKTAGNEVRLKVLKNAEKRAIEAALQEKIEAVKRQKKEESTPVTTLIGIGAVSAVVIVVGLAIYKNRLNIKEMLAGMFVTSDKYSSVSSQRYRY